MSSPRKTSLRSSFPLLAVLTLAFYSAQFYLDARSSILSSGISFTRSTAGDTGPQNSFIRNYPGVEHVFMPLLGFVAPRIGASDFFGLGSQNYYFESCSDCIDVFLSGHTAGLYTQSEESLARLLERALKEKTGRRWRVWDVAQDHSTLAYQILQYFHLGFWVEPEFVISNGLALELRDALASPPAFQRLGLALAPWEYTWAAAIHPGNFNTPGETAPPSAAVLVDGTLKGLKRYSDLAAGNGGTFIVSLPPGEENLLAGESSSILSPAYRALLAELEKSYSVIDRRTEQRPSAAEVAERYASVLVEKLGSQSRPAPNSAAAKPDASRSLVFCETCELLTGTGKVLRQEPENISGELDLVRGRSNTLDVKGWAYNIIAEAPVTSVLIFIGPKLAAEIKPGLPHAVPGKSEPVAGAGFETALPLESPLQGFKEVRVFARTESHGYKELLRR